MSPLVLICGNARVADLSEAMTHPGDERLPCRALAEQLNAAGSRSSRGLEWTVSSLRRPRVAALEEILVRNELSALPDDFVSVTSTATTIIPHETMIPGVELEEIYKTNPKFGMF
jgi:hypothetical protein